MSRITQKGQVTIPKKIRDMLGIKPNDIGEFKVKENSIVFMVRKGTILNAHRKRTGREVDYRKVRDIMAEKIAKKTAKGEK